MKLKVQQSELAGYISSIGRIVDSKPSLPVLGNILIEANKGSLVLSATNLEMSMRAVIKADVEEEGTTTVPAKTFAEFISSLPSGDVIMSLEGQLFHVSTEDSKAQFNTMDFDNFPEMPEHSGKADMSLSAQELEKALGCVLFSASVDHSSPVFTGIYFDKAEKGLTLVSSDGYRLSQYLMKMKSVPKTLPWLVPAKTLREISKLISGAADKATVDFYLVADGKQVLMTYGDVEVYSRVIEGDYPDYNSAIPSDTKINANMEFSAFKDALHRVNIFAREEPGNKVTMTLSANEKKIYLESTLSEVGSNRTSIPAIIKGGDMTIVFNAKNLTDFSSTISGENLVFSGTSSDFAGVFKVEGNDEYLHIVMPMSLN